MDRESVTQVPEHYISAVSEKDVDALLSLYDDNVRIFDLWGEWTHEGAPAWRQSVTDWFASLGDQRVSVSFEDIRTIVAEDLATLLSVITYRDMGTDGVARGSMQNRLTWVLKRSGNHWKIVHEHTSAPVDFETQKVLLRRY